MKILTKYKVFYYASVFSAIIGLEGCASLSGLPSGLTSNDLSSLPRESAGANRILIFQANKNCKYYVDGQYLATGKRVRVILTNHPHEVDCHARGYRVKKDYIQPPYDQDTTIGFTFFIGDRLKSEEIGSADLSKQTLKKKLFSSVDHPRYRMRVSSRKFAFVIGIEHYAPGIPPATYALRDFKAVNAHLIALGIPPRHIKRLSDTTATKSRIQGGLRWLRKNVKPGATVFIYFSGHGAPSEKGNAYLVPYDGDPSDLRHSGILLASFYDELQSLPARRIVVMIDSCFSGTGGRSVMVAGARPLVSKIKAGFVSSSGKLIVLSAAKSDQESGVIKREGHGLFTYYLLKGLNGGAVKKGHITVQELFAFLKPKVEDQASLDNRSQTPTMAPKSSQDIGSIRIR
jgi:hypothetical protein